jgi:hypothetical protein
MQNRAILIQLRVLSIEYAVFSELLNALEIFAEISAINPKHIQSNLH